MDAGFKGTIRSLLIEDAAVLLGVSRRTVYYRIRQGRLDTVRTLGGSQRVLLASIERLLHQRRQLTQVSLNNERPPMQTATSQDAGA